MKYLIASDLHGSSHFIKKLKDQFLKSNCDKLILLGDLLYHGPRNSLPDTYDTIESANILNSLKDNIIVVRGNCDANVDQNMLDFSIKENNMLLIDNDIVMYLTHGDIYNKSNLPPINNMDILIHGHTHIPIVEEIGINKYYINPGSISIPKGGSTNSYIIYENGIFTWYDIEGNKYKEFKFNKHV